MKNKQLRKWALVAEIVSAAAVVITIAFLAYQMKENTNALRAQTYQELMRDLNAWRSSIKDLESGLSNSHLAEAIAGGTPDEVGAIRITFLELWGIYEAAFFARERGVLGDNEWSRFEYMICFEHDNAIDQKFWDWEFEGLPPFTKVLTPIFVEYVDKQCTQGRK